MASAAREVAPRPGAIRLARALCALSVALAMASVALAAFNGEDLIGLAAEHHAIGILNALVLAPIGALIVVGDRRHLLAWLLLVDSLALATFNFAEQYGPLALGLTSRQLSLPGGDLASWLASWTNLPGVVISVVFLVLLFPDGRLPTRRWWPVGVAGAVVLVVPTTILAVRTWPLRGPGLIAHEGEGLPLVSAMFAITFATALVLGAVSVVALVRRFRRAGAVQRQQIKWFAYGAGLSIPLGLFPEVEPWGPFAELLGAALQLAGVGIGIFRFRLWDIDRLVNRTLVYGLLTVMLGVVYAGLVLALGLLSGGIGATTPSWAVAGATLAVAALFQPARRRVQQAVDLRFNRRKYDAVRTIERFSTRLRDQVDLATLSAELLVVVDTTMQPASASLWLRRRPPVRPRLPGTRPGYPVRMADYERAQTVEAPAGALFEFLADVGNLPRYFEEMTAAEPAGGEAVRVTAEVEGREREGEAWFRVDRERQRVEWGSEGPNDYHGWLDVTDEGGGRSTVAVHVATVRVEDRPDEINQGLERTIGNVKRLVEEQGAADR